MKLPLRAEGYFGILDADGNQFAVVNVTASDGEATELRDRAAKAINAFPVLVEALIQAEVEFIDIYHSGCTEEECDEKLKYIRNALKLAKGE